MWLKHIGEEVYKDDGTIYAVNLYTNQNNKRKYTYSVAVYCTKGNSMHQAESRGFRRSEVDDAVKHWNETLEKYKQL